MKLGRCVFITYAAIHCQFIASHLVASLCTSVVPSSLNKTLKFLTLHDHPCKFQTFTLSVFLLLLFTSKYSLSLVFLLVLEQNLCKEIVLLAEHSILGSILPACQELPKMTTLFVYALDALPMLVTSRKVMSPTC